MERKNHQRASAASLSLLEKVVEDQCILSNKFMNSRPTNEPIEIASWGIRLFRSYSENLARQEEEARIKKGNLGSFGLRYDTSYREQYLRGPVYSSADDSIPSMRRVHTSSLAPGLASEVLKTDRSQYP